MSGCNFCSLKCDGQSSTNFFPSSHFTDWSFFLPVDLSSLRVRFCFFLYWVDKVRLFTPRKHFSVPLWRLWIASIPPLAVRGPYDVKWGDLHTSTAMLRQLTWSLRPPLSGDQLGNYWGDSSYSMHHPSVGVVTEMTIQITSPSRRGTEMQRHGPTQRKTTPLQARWPAGVFV